MQINVDNNDGVHVIIPENNTIVVEASEQEVFDIDLDSVELIDIYIGDMEELDVIVSDIGSRDSFPEYEGPYSVIPRKVPQVLDTKEKSTMDDITVEQIRYSETSNISGGETVIIGYE